MKWGQGNRIWGNCDDLVSRELRAYNLIKIKRITGLR
jgi:hypothetical protein